MIYLSDFGLESQFVLYYDTDDEEWVGGLETLKTGGEYLKNAVKIFNRNITACSKQFA